MGLGKGKNKILTTLFHLFLFPSQGFWVCCYSVFSCFMEKEKGGKKKGQCDWMGDNEPALQADTFH